MTSARLAFRLQRSSILFAAFVCLGLAALAVWLAASLGATLAECASPAAAHDCGVISLFGSPLGDPTHMFSLGVGVATYAVPLVLGVPLVSGEVERRTAMMAWPLAGSRPKWLAWRAGTVLIIGVVLMGVMAAAAEALAQATDPSGTLGYAGHGTRGVSLLLRSTLMLIVAVTVGAAVGRLLPALLISAALAVGISIAVDLPLPYGVASTELTAAENLEHPLTTGHAYRAPDGTPISDDEAEAMSMAVFAEYSPELPPDSLLPISVSYGIAGARYSEVLVREAALLIGATVLAGAVATGVVARRRPE